MKHLNAVVRMVTLGVLMGLAGSVAAQQTYPNKPIRLIIPVAMGGGSSILARLIAQELTEILGQQMIVDSRPGGNTVVGTEALAKAPPDGYTLLLAGSSHVVIPFLISTTFDPIKDFAPVATIAKGEVILALNLSVPANDLQELIALAKSKPGQLNYATYGTGSMSHLGTELFSIMAGIKMQHIPYKGGAPAITDLIGGQVQLYLGATPAIIPHIKSGRLKAVAISGESRSSAVPQVPTFTEAGLPGLDVRSLQMILAPASTPKEIIDKLSAQIAGIVARPDFKQKLTGQGLEPFYTTPDQLAALMKADMARFANVIKTANIKMEN